MRYDEAIALLLHHTIRRYGENRLAGIRDEAS